jgi:serine/threonine protein kinase
MPEPQKISKYTILERIGRGGMGYVYRAHDPILKRDVALKTMLRDVSDDQDLRNRFMREAQSAGGLRHPNIVTIYDLGEDDQGCPYIAMEFLTGTDLEQIIKSKTPVPLLKKLDIIIQTCQGLGFAHANGIVHRDIKTANIRLLDNGEVKIMDFGIAKMTASHFTRTGMIMGTPHYMAPEQIRGEKVDGRADIFSLGVLLYELLVYRKPFPGETPTTVLFKIIHEKPEPLVDADFTLPEGLEDIVLRTIAKKPDDRYQTCEELAEDLRYIYNLVQQQQIESGELAVHTQLPQSFSRAGFTPQPLRRSSPPASPTSFPVPTAAEKTSLGTPLPQQEFTSKAEATKMEPPARSAEGFDPTVIPPAPYTAPSYPAGREAEEFAVEETYSQQDLPPISPTPIPSPTKIWWIVASSGILGVGLLATVLIGALHKPTPKIIQPSPTPVIPAKPTPKIHEPAPLKLIEGSLVLNVQPWAEIKEIKASDGSYVTPAFAITPCKLQLAPGKYQVTLTNPQFGTKTLEIEIQSHETLMVNETLKGFDHAKALESLGL